MSKPTKDPKVTRWWWRTLREWVYDLVDPLWGAFRGENTDEITLANVTAINGVSTAELAVLDGLTATTAELNKLAGLTADATDLNKTDRTQVDGVAEASKVVVLDANKDILGKRYDINQSLLEAVAGQPLMHLDGNGYVSVPDNGHLDFGTGDFSVLVVMKTDDTTAGSRVLTKDQSTANPAWQLDLASGSFSLRDGSNSASVGLGSFNDGRWHALAAVADRDDKLYGYVDGVEKATDVGITSVGSVNNSKPMVFGARYNFTSKSIISYLRALIFNRALSADEIKALSSGAPLVFADVGASQTDRVANGDAWTGASGSTPPNSWSDSGSGTAGYAIRDNTGVTNMDSDTLELAVIGSGSKTLSQTMLQPGKRYRVSFVYRNLDGNSSTIVALGTSANSVTLQSAGITGDGVLFEQELVADGPDLLFVVDIDGVLQIDKVQVVQIGCV
ncbi:MAG: LamG domain-containing protein, partial [Candidatus Marinimicrobia bacterium]|nr:LamG domain-containing protein [Candidatus Neomarinimicrobiota bacterium]